jgi:hypothetical protein
LRNYRKFRIFNNILGVLEASETFLRNFKEFSVILENFQKFFEIFRNFLDIFQEFSETFRNFYEFSGILKFKKLRDFHNFRNIAGIWQEKNEF